jgi:O-antigen/teichoic acid export membrane protein
VSNTSGTSRADSKLDEGSAGAGRRRRLLHGWSANVVQLGLGLTQQLVLIPVFLHFWDAETLAAWLALYAASMLAQVADCGLQLRAINRFVSFKSCIDCDRRTGNFYFRLLHVYIGNVAILSVVLVAGMVLFPPSTMLGFEAIPAFDFAFGIVTLGTLFVLPSGLVTGLYRVHGRYARGVWLQNATSVISQIAQVIVVAWTGSVLAVAIVYTVSWLFLAVFLIALDRRRQYAFSHAVGKRPSLRWWSGQLKCAFPFGVAAFADLSLLYLPMLLVSALVADRLMVAQWGLIRAIVGLVRAVPVLVTMPLAPELAHEYAIGSKDRLRHLYSRASVLVTAVTSMVAASFLSFSEDFFLLWTHGNVPYDPNAAAILLLGSVALAPSILAVGVANYSNRGSLLMRLKGLQLILFLPMAVVLILGFGTLGAALAIVATDLAIQSGLLAVVVKGVLRRPLKHFAFVALVNGLVVAVSWGIGIAIGTAMPGGTALHFFLECAGWLLALGVIVGLLQIKPVRTRVGNLIPD